MSIDPDDRPGFEATRERTRAAGRSVYQTIHESVVAGLAVLVPIIITLLVLNAAIGYVFGALDVLIEYLTQIVGFEEGTSEMIVRGLVVVGLGVTVLLVGFLTRFQFGELVIEYVDFAIQLIPGVGAVYKSFRQMSDVMVESDSKNFRDVKLVEFPNEGVYTMGFKTTRTPTPLQEAAAEEGLVTLFLPLAPNPVMGGHLVHVPEERVRDVDMTVEEGIRTVVTSGVATADPVGDARGLDRSELTRIGAHTHGEPVVFEDDPRTESVGQRPDGTSEQDRERTYDRYVAPDHPREESHPADVGDYRDGETLGRDADRPRDVAADNPDNLGDDADHPTDVADSEGTIGDDADHYEGVERDHDDTLGDDADHPEAVGPDDRD